MLEEGVWNGRGSAPRRAVIVLIAVCSLATGVQALMVPEDIPGLTAGADEVVRGTIANVQSHWTADHTNIVTTATVRVKSRIKGQGPDAFTIMVPGGTVEDVTQWVEDQPVLRSGTENFVFVKQSPKWGATIHGGYQGLIPIHQDKVGRDVKGKGSVVTADQYEGYLSALAAGSSATPPEPNGTASASGATPVITGVSPATAAAGTGTQVTITGSGFGTKSSRGSAADVAFTYICAPDGISSIYCSGYPYFDDNANDIVSWSDTRIVVNVPIGYTADGYSGSASSGFVFVVTEAGTVSGYAPFRVTYGYGKLRWNAPVQYRVNPGSLGQSAIDAVTNAAGTWNGAIPASSFWLNYAGTSSSTEIGQNNENLICFRPASDFSDPNIIAMANTWFIGDEIVEVDIKFNLGFPWTTGIASGSTMNVEAITLHELGHWLHLRDLYGYNTAYPTDIGKVMLGINSDSFGNKNLKTLHADDLAGIRWIYPPTQTVTATPISTPTVMTVPGASGLPTDTNADGKYDDVNGNGDRDFADIVLYFTQMDWIATWEPVAAFDYNANGAVDFADIVWLFDHL